MPTDMKKIGTRVSIMMGLTVSLVLSLAGTLAGGHFTVFSWLTSYAISAAISLLIGFMVPVKLLGDKFCALCKVTPGTFKGTLASAAVSNLIYTPLLTVIMVNIMVSSAAAHIPAGLPVPQVADYLPRSLTICLLTGYVTCAILQPIMVRLAFGKQKSGE